MKKGQYIFWIVSLLISTSSYGQDFAPIGAKWYYSEGFAFSGDENFMQIVSEKDTVIHGKSCRKLIKIRDLYCTKRPLIEFVYFENGVVYLFDDWANEFQILYDFNSIKNSSWTIKLNDTDIGEFFIKVNVDSVSEQSINEKLLKVLHVTYDVMNSALEIQLTYTSKVMETIGDVGYLFNLYPISSLFCDGNYSMGLRCYDDSEFGFYSTGIVDSCNFVYNWNDYEFAPIGAEWYYSEHAGGATPVDSEYVLYKSVKDTVILGSLAKKIERTYYLHNGDTSYLTPYFVMQGINRVYLWNPNANKFDLLYEFNASVGDTLTLDVPYEMQSTISASTYRLVIDSIVLETYNNIILKKYQIRPLDGFSWMSNWIMDKAGGLDWFIPRGAIILEAGGPLRCYRDNKVDIKFVAIDCDYRSTSNIKTNRFDNLLIYPNPTSGLFRIKTDENIDKVEVFNCLGKLLKSSTEEEIDLTKYPTGTYLIRIEIDNNTILREVVKR